MMPGLGVRLPEIINGVLPGLAAAQQRSGRPWQPSKYGGTVDIKEINKKVIEQFRAGGEIDGMRRDRLVLLTTVGAKSGQRRTTPMMCLTW